MIKILKSNLNIKEKEKRYDTLVEEKGSLIIDVDGKQYNIIDEEGKLRILARNQGMGLIVFPNVSNSITLDIGRW